MLSVYIPQPSLHGIGMQCCMPVSLAYRQVAGSIIAWMTETDLLSLQLQSCFHFSPGQNHISHFFAPVTLTLTRWLSYINLTRLPWKCACRPKSNFLGPGFRKLSYYYYFIRTRSTFEKRKEYLLPGTNYYLTNTHTDRRTDRRTDRQTDRGDQKHTTQLCGKSLNMKDVRILSW